jgi:pimeloyl-ACP methyl ester carboxylesterase
MTTDIHAKSTIGRSDRSRWLAAAGRAASALLPGPTAALAARLWLRTTRRPPTERERQLLAGSEHRRLVVDGIPLALWSRGAGPTVLLAHGWNGRGSQLAAFVQPLVASGHRVVLFDLPGHGASPGRSSSIPAMARAVAAMTRAFAPVAAVVAHSAGAMATTWALARAGARAERLVYVAPATDLDRTSRQAAAVLGLAPAVERAMRRRVERRVGVRWDDLDPVRYAAELALPLLVVHDRGDRQVPAADGERLAASWPGAQLVLTRGLGHQRILWDRTVIARAARFAAGAAELPIAAGAEEAGAARRLASGR